MNQFNAFQPEQNSKADLVEAWKIACKENIKLQKRVIKLEKQLKQAEQAWINMGGLPFKFNSKSDNA